MPLLPVPRQHRPVPGAAAAGVEACVVCMLPQSIPVPGVAAVGVEAGVVRMLHQHTPVPGALVSQVEMGGMPCRHTSVGTVRSHASQVIGGHKQLQVWKSTSPAHPSLSSTLTCTTRACSSKRHTGRSDSGAAADGRPVTSHVSLARSRAKREVAAHGSAPTAELRRERRSSISCGACGCGGVGFDGCGQDLSGKSTAPMHHHHFPCCSYSHITCDVWHTTGNCHKHTEPDSLASGRDHCSKVVAAQQHRHRPHIL